MKSLRSTAFFAIMVLPLTLPAATVHVISNDGFMNVRLGPGSTHPIIDKIKKGETSTLTAFSSGKIWVQVRTPGGDLGYVYHMGVQVRANGVNDNVPVDDSVIEIGYMTEDPDAQPAKPPPSSSKPPALGFTNAQLMQAANDFDAAQQYNDNTGDDYQMVVAKAAALNAQALHSLLSATFFDGAGFDMHATTVFRLMHRVGDTRFAIAVSKLSIAQKNNVASWIENEMEGMGARLKWSDYLKMHFNETANKLGLNNP